MLYIWPLFAFFSAPLLLPAVLQPVLSIFTSKEEFAAASARASPRRRASADALSGLLSLAGYASLAPLALAIVRYNTVVHPFTLADNRHYMFYVFRYSILRAGWVRYALVTVYVGCGILCWRALGGFSSSSSSFTRPQQTHPQEKPRAGEDGKSSSSSDAKDDHDEQHHSSPSSPTPTPPVHDNLSSPGSTSAAPPPLSTALLWLLATALSLVTAPLVEPRYFILSWLFWRLLAPAWSLSPSLPPSPPASRPTAAPAPAPALALDLGRRYDLRLWLETAWFAAINALTMWVFVTRPFYWHAGDGSPADGGRTQRFMW